MQGTSFTICWWFREESLIFSSLTKLSKTVFERGGRYNEAKSAKITVPRRSKNTENYLHSLLTFLVFTVMVVLPISHPTGSLNIRSRLICYRSKLPLKPLSNFPSTPFITNSHQPNYPASLSPPANQVLV